MKNCIINNDTNDEFVATLWQSLLLRVFLTVCISNPMRIQYSRTLPHLNKNTGTEICKHKNSKQIQKIQLCK